MEDLHASSPVEPHSHPSQSKPLSLVEPISPSMPPLEETPFSLISSPMHPIEPTSDHEVPIPPLIPPPFVSYSNEILISHSSPSPIVSCSQKGKGKEILISPTPVNSLASSPTNSIGNDLDFLLSKKALELKSLTTH